jgi:hypothetical protein
MRYGREILGGKARQETSSIARSRWAQKVGLKIKVVTWANQIEEGVCKVNKCERKSKRKKECEERNGGGKGRRVGKSG